METAHVNLRRDGQRRTIERVEVVTLTKDGRNLLLEQGGMPEGQRVYAGLVKPREVEHDSQIYRAYRKEAERIEQKGGTNLRVKLDFEIKADVQKAIYAERKADPAGTSPMLSDRSRNALSYLLSMAAFRFPMRG